MAIWDKLIGAASGLLFGEPGERDGTREIAFTIGVIALSAKMAKADGAVTADEAAAFRQVVQVPPEELANVARLFDLAKRDIAGYETYARRIARLFPPRAPVLEDLIEALFFIATADRRVHEDEIAYLARVAELFGFAAADFERIRAGQLGPEGDPYAILGLRRDASDEEVRAAWRRLARAHHPDRLTGEGLPREFILVANSKLARINGAYSAIREHRRRP